MQTRRLGRTGHECSLAVLGGIAFHFTPGEQARQLLGSALDAGVNAVDVAPGYGEAELHLGAVLPPVRDRLFLAGKTAARTAVAARAELERTLQRLQVDQLDLYQLHGLLTVADLDERGPVLEMMLAARDEGLCRFVGTTGHDLGTAAAQHEALRRYGTDTVMLPVNPRMVAHTEYWADLSALLDACCRDDVGVLAIKAGARRPWTVPAEERTATTWYDPWRDQADLSASVRFALSQPPVAGFCTPGDLDVLPLALRAAQEFVPMSPEEQAEAARRAAELPSVFPMPA